MSRDHLMPRFLRTLTKQKTPKYSIMLTVLFVLIILLLFDPTKIAKLAGAFQLLLFALISVAVIVMRESRLDSYDPGFHSPLYPWMQIFGILAPLALIIGMGWLPSLFTLLFILIGILYYFYYGKERVGRDGAIYHIFARLGQRRYDGLDTELRGILKEKGLRDQDPFDAVVTKSVFLDYTDEISFEEIVKKVSAYFSDMVDCDTDVLIRSFLEGTQIGATPVSHGAALPHIRIHGMRHSKMIMVRSRTGVHVDIDPEIIGEEDAKRPIHALFFLASPEDKPGQHLRILAQIASVVDNEHFIGQWLNAENEQELKELMLREDRYISLMLSANSNTQSLINCKVRDLQLPEGCLVALIHRFGEIIVPSGRTVLNENDRMTIIGSPQGIQELYKKYYND